MMSLLDAVFARSLPVGSIPPRHGSVEIKVRIAAPGPLPRPLCGRRRCGQIQCIGTPVDRPLCARR